MTRGEAQQADRQMQEPDSRMCSIEIIIQIKKVF